MLHYIMPGLQTGTDIVLHDGSYMSCSTWGTPQEIKVEFCRRTNLKPFNFTEKEWEKLLTDLPFYSCVNEKPNVRYIGSYYDGVNDKSVLLGKGDFNSIKILIAPTNRLRGIMPGSLLRFNNRFSVGYVDFSIINDWKNCELLRGETTLIDCNKLTNEIVVGKIADKREMKAVNDVLESYLPTIKARVFEIDGVYALLSV